MFSKRISVVFGILSIVLWLSLKPETGNVTILSSRIEKQSITLPYNNLEHAEPDTFIIEAKLKRPFAWSGGVQLIPDDCVQAIWLDGKRLDTSSISKIGLCDYQNGFFIKLPGENLRISIINTGGPFGLKFTRTDKNLWMFGVALLAALAMFRVFYEIGIRFKLIKKTAIIFSTAISIGLFLVGGFSHQSQGVQAWSNLYYVFQPAYYEKLPKATECITCNQPPLYFWTAGLLHRVLNKFLAVELPVKFLQLFSLFTWGIFLLIGYQIFTQLKVQEQKKILLFGLLCFLPLNYFVFLKTGPESMFAVFTAGCIYYAVLYYQKNKRLDFVRAVILQFAALATHFYALALTPFLITLWISMNSRKKISSNEPDFSQSQK